MAYGEVNVNASALTDTTLTQEGIPADAKAVGEQKLSTSGGTMTGALNFSGGRNCSILIGDKDAANGPGEPLNNLVIRSWFGVSFTTDCPNQTYTGKTAVGIDCREGIIKAARFDGKIDVNYIYPVGAIYMSTDSTSPASIFGGSWQSIASERVLMGASNSHAAGSTVNAGLPNITGDISDLFVGRSFGNTNGVFSASSPDYNTKYSSGS